MTVQMFFLSHSLAKALFFCHSSITFRRANFFQFLPRYVILIITIVNQCKMLTYNGPVGSFNLGFSRGKESAI